MTLVRWIDIPAKDSRRGLGTSNPPNQPEAIAAAPFIGGCGAAERNLFRLSFLLDQP
jgi:hypothetical protein